MARPTELKHRFSMTINFEYDEIKEFQQTVGEDNVSRELRAMVKKFNENQKKGEAHKGPLNLFGLQWNLPIKDNNTQSTLDIYLSSKREIREFIDNLDDVQVLAQIEDNARAIKSLAHAKKMNQCALDRIKKGLK